MTPEQIDLIVKHYETGGSMSALAREMGVGHGTVFNRLRERGVAATRGPRRRYQFRQDAFADWGDRGVQYWIGFLMGDGFIAKNGWSVRVLLHVRDRGHLEKLRAFVGGDQPIRSYEHEDARGWGTARIACVEFHSTVTVRDLARAGVVNRKSLIARAAPELADKPDFWRGYVDANGTVSSPEWGSGRRQVAVAGAEPIVEQFTSFVEAVVGPPRYSVYRQTSICRVAAYAGRAVRLMEILYADAPVALSLDRKRARALAYLARADEHLAHHS